MLYYLTNRDLSTKLPELRDVVIRETDDIAMLSGLCKISFDEARRRIANDNKAYVAFYRGIPAAFGWMAMGKVRIGELGHEMIMPLDHRYLWNFRTLGEFRGRGLYPALLQFIVDSGRGSSECFWILHAPENAASESGIRKAGFIFAGHVSVSGSQVFFNASAVSGFDDITDALGFTVSAEEPATCWMCSSPYLAHRRKECCCDPAGTQCNGELFAHRALEEWRHAKRLPNV